MAYIHRQTSMMQSILQLMQKEQQRKSGEKAALRQDIFSGGEAIAKGFQKQSLEKKQTEEREKERKQEVTDQDIANLARLAVSGQTQIVQPTQTQLPSGVAGPLEAPQLPAGAMPLPVGMGGRAMPGAGFVERAGPRAGYTMVTPQLADLIKTASPKRSKEVDALVGTEQPNTLITSLMRAPTAKAGRTMITPELADLMKSANPKKSKQIDALVGTEQPNTVLTSLLRAPTVRAEPKAEFEKYLATAEGKEVQKLVAAGKTVSPASAAKLETFGVKVEKKKWRVPWAKTYEVPEGLVPEEMKEKPKEYKTAEDVKAAFAAGDLNKEEAAKLLREKFGYD